MKRRLTDKQRVFCEHYLQTWNATEAARLAKYKGNEVTLGSVGYENLQKPQIKNYIEKRLRELTLKANEVLIRLTQQATASLADFVKPAGNLFVIDMEKVRANGHLVKKLRYTKQGVEFELYDAQAALVHLGRHYGLFSDKIRIEDWRTDIIELLKKGALTPQAVLDELGNDLAQELFVSAGLHISQGGEAEAAGESPSAMA